MLFRVTELEGASLAALDGAIGEVEDFYFDDTHWTVRYLVVNTGGWLAGRHVLVSPASVRQIDLTNDHVVVELTRKQVEDSPNVDTHQPVSRRHEVNLLAHYGIPLYWLGPFPWGPVPLPMPATPGSPVDDEMLARHEQDETADAHLHSARDVVGYEIEARDDAIGHVADFLVDDKAWTIRWLVVDTGHWLPGKQVLVSPEWVEDVAWAARAVRVGLTRAQIQGAPAYDPERPVERDYERRLYEYYGRPSYWGSRAA